MFKIVIDLDLKRNTARVRQVYEMPPLDLFYSPWGWRPMYHREFGPRRECC